MRKTFRFRSNFRARLQALKPDMTHRNLLEMLLVSVSIKDRTSSECCFCLISPFVERKGFKQFTKAYNFVVPIHLSQVFSRYSYKIYSLYRKRKSVMTTALNRIKFLPRQYQEKTFFLYWFNCLIYSLLRKLYLKSK